MKWIMLKLKSKLVYPIKTVLSTGLNKLKCRMYDIEYGTDFITRGILLIDGDKGDVKIGNNVLINSAPWANPIGAGTSTQIRIMGGTLEIGDRVGISNTGLAVSEYIKIEDDVMIGAGCKIYDTDFHAIDYEDRMKQMKALSRPIVIHKGAFIGAGTTILKGTEIGEKSVIGAGSVLAGKIVPPGEIWAGNPARFIKKIETELD